MSFTLWLSAEEDQILSQIMRLEGSRNKEQAVIKAIRDKGALLLAEQKARDTPIVIKDTLTVDTAAAGSVSVDGTSA